MIDADGRTENFSYDKDGRLTGETWVVSGTTVNTQTFDYDLGGRLTLAAGSSTGTITLLTTVMPPTQVTHAGTDVFGLTLT